MKTVTKKIEAVQQDYGDFLLKLDAGSNGFLFRHGWVIRLILGLTAQDPTKRMKVHEAWEIAVEATSSVAAAPAPRADAAALAAPMSSAAATAASGRQADATALKTSDASPVVEARAGTGKAELDSSQPSKPKTSPKPQGKSRPPELERFRKLAARDSSGEPFRSLEAMLNIAD